MRFLGVVMSNHLEICAFERHLSHKSSPADRTDMMRRSNFHFTSENNSQIRQYVSTSFAIIRPWSLFLLWTTSTNLDVRNSFAFAALSQLKWGRLNTSRFDDHL